MKFWPHIHGMVRCYLGSLSESEPGFEATQGLSCEFGAGTLFCIKISAASLNSPSGSSVDGLETLMLIQFHEFRTNSTCTWRPFPHGWTASCGRGHDLNHARCKRKIHEIALRSHSHCNCYLEEKAMGRSLLILFCAILTCGECTSLV